MGMHQMMPRQAPSWDFPTFGVFAIILKSFYQGGGGIIDFTAAPGTRLSSGTVVTRAGLWPLCLP